MNHQGNGSGCQRFEFWESAPVPECGEKITGFDLPNFLLMDHDFFLLPLKQEFVCKDVCAPYFLLELVHHSD